MDTPDRQEISNPTNSPTTQTKSPTWPKVVFGIDLVILVLTSLTFIGILTGGWQKKLNKNFGDEAPAVIQAAYVNAVITFVFVVIGIVANIFLLKPRRIGVILGLIALGFVVLAIAVQLWGAASARNPMAMSVQGPISVLRILYNVAYLLALLRTRKTLLGEKHAPLASTSANF